MPSESDRKKCLENTKRSADGFRSLSLWETHRTAILIAAGASLIIEVVLLAYAELSLSTILSGPVIFGLSVVGIVLWSCYKDTGTIDPIMLTTCFGVKSGIGALGNVAAVIIEGSGSFICNTPLADPKVGKAVADASAPVTTVPSTFLANLMLKMGIRI